MPFYVYILHSEIHGRFYIGQTEDMEQRVNRHNNGYEKATSPYVPWMVQCVLEKATRSEAVKLDRKLKNLNRQKLLLFIARYGSN